MQAAILSSMHRRAALGSLGACVLSLVLLFSCSSDPAEPVSAVARDAGTTNADTGVETKDAGAWIVVDLAPTTGRSVTSCSPVDAGPDAAAGHCNADSECGATTPCDCDYHQCFTASNCRTDADCPSGERCGRSQIPGASYSAKEPIIDDIATGYFCTTPDDDCMCSRYVGDGYEPSESCAYNVTRKRWLCVAEP